MSLKQMSPFSIISSYCRFFLILFLGISVLNSCKTHKNTPSNLTKDTLSDYVLSAFNKNEFLFNRFSSKMQISIDVDGKAQSFSANFRMKKDSIMWISVCPIFGIEVMRMILTQDSVKILNRLDNTFLLADNNYMKTLLKADVDFTMLQSVLTGTDFPHFETGVFDVKKDDGGFNLSAKKRTKLRNIYNNSNLTINQKINIENETYKIIKNNFNDIEEKYKFEINYSNFHQTENQFFPYKIDCKILAGAQLLNISVDYSRINLTADFNYPFTIPDKYSKKL